MKNVYCYFYDQMADFEVVLLLHRLHAVGGMRIVTLAERPEAVTSQSGLRYLPDATIAQADPMAAEALIIPGGPINNEQNAILPLLTQMHSAGKLIAAICFGPQFPARAGLLKGRRYTTSCTPEHLAQAGQRDPFPRESFADSRVVEDGSLITAQGHAFVDFAQTVCARLGVGTTPEEAWALFGKVKAGQ